VPYADQPRSLTHNAPHNGRSGAAYRAVLEAVRERVRAGERCYFWRKRGHERTCLGRIDLRLPANHRYGFTMHHKLRLMDGGAALPRLADVAPAHRSCNARDGLMAQNERRRMRKVQRARADAHRSAPMSHAVGIQSVGIDRHSQPW